MVARHGVLSMPREPRTLDETVTFSVHVATTYAVAPIRLDDEHASPRRSLPSSVVAIFDRFRKKAEIELTAELVRELLRDQQPDLADRPLSLGARG